jgi:hypothetical protein
MNVLLIEACSEFFSIYISLSFTHYSLYSLDWDKLKLFFSTVENADAVNAELFSSLFTHSNTHKINQLRD